jgi:hypothetical protein
MEHPSQELLLRLAGDARAGLSQRGFHFLSRDEVDDLCGLSSDPGARFRRLKLFAGTCGAYFDTNRDITAARLTNSADGSAADSGDIFGDSGSGEAQVAGS